MAQESAEQSLAQNAPVRWDKPFADAITDKDIAQIKSVQPFASMDEKNFPPSMPLSKIIQNDMRMVHFKKSEVVCREGDYGNSVFLILSGKICISNMPPVQLIKNNPSGISQYKGPFAKLKQLWGNSRVPEVRALGARNSIYDRPGMNVREDLIKEAEEKGIIFEKEAMLGEIAALTRAPRTATLFASSDLELVEIRWQGLRDMMRFDETLNQHVINLYRERSLKTELSHLPLLSTLDEQTLAKIANIAVYETYGSFAWYAPYKAAQTKSPEERLKDEPVIINEQDYLDGIYIVAAGFCRLSEVEGNGHRTLGYLGKDDVFGLEECCYQKINQEPVPAQRTIRAIGYVNLLHIPTHIVQEYILPTLTSEKLKELADSVEPKTHTNSGKIDQDLMEFLVDNRYINGTATMVIDTERCVRCDECVRACEVAHDNNPRFTRQGSHHGRFMIAEACMHCVDPVCMIGCPTGAIHRSHSGQVVINPNTCIGCGTCSNNCPYSAIKMVDIHDADGNRVISKETNKPVEQATKCDLCIDQHNDPACQRACPHDALKRIDMRDIDNLANWIASK